MDAPSCSGCCARDAEIAALRRDNASLQQRIEALEARLGVNSTNSSLPPSANPLHAPKPVVKKKSRRRRGGQSGHPPHLKHLLPPERVDTVITFVPEQCRHCQAPLAAEAQTHDPAPSRHQVVELPPLLAEVTEYQGHYRTCSSCGEVTHATIPQELREHSVGPRLAAALSYFSGCHGVSKRGVEEIAAAIFNAPVALGTVANLEQEMSAALQSPHAEALAAVRQADVKHADETGWKQAGDKRWLWAAATTTVAAFVIHAKRSRAGFIALLGKTVLGILCSDRWGVYKRVPTLRRQLCWAHVKRDFQKLIDRGGAANIALGKRGLVIVKKVFAAWHAYRDGKFTRTQLQTAMAPFEKRLNRLLGEGWILSKDTKTKTFCDNLLKLESALWTFTRVEGVEPTNNHIERLLRRAVLWRRRSFGCSSARGCRFVERILTVVQTRRLQGESVLEYLHAALSAHRQGLPSPTLVGMG